MTRIVNLSHFVILYAFYVLHAFYLRLFAFIQKTVYIILQSFMRYFLFALLEFFIWLIYISTNTIDANIRLAKYCPITSITIILIDRTTFLNSDDVVFLINLICVSIVGIAWHQDDDINRQGASRLQCKF